MSERPCGYCSVQRDGPVSPDPLDLPKPTPKGSFCVFHVSLFVSEAKRVSRVPVHVCVPMCDHRWEMFTLLFTLREGF